MYVPFREVTRFKERSSRVGWIIMPNGCHIWQSGKDKDGYGLVTVDNRSRRVHRLRYEQEVGPIPEGMQLDHFVCETPSCCNPAHVRPVTARENSLRGRSVSAVNAAKTHCPQGHALTPDNVFPVHKRNGQRGCKKCINAKSLARYYAAKARKQEEASAEAHV